jgi:Fungal Zn(2)-Cys(6) binuclear cluster domain
MMQRYSQRGRPTCDACAFRRVKCDGGQPCIDCYRRSIACTRLRQRRKRGPKGPRPATVDRIAKYKETLERTISSHLVTPPAATNSTCENSANDIPPSWSYKIAPAAYHAHLEIFRLRLYTIWPVVDAQDLAHRLADDAEGWQSHALAASLCAAVIAQLRLDQHPVAGIDSQAHEFAKVAQQLRKQNDYREYCSFDSLLSSFFLHIYFSNVQKLSTAAYLLRETVTTGHILRLNEPSSYETLPPREYQRRLRIFWMLFVTER